MDGHFLDPTKPGAGYKTIAFLTSDQAALYGGYVDAAKTLHVDFIRPPCFIEEHYADMTGHTYGEVGHG